MLREAIELIRALWSEDRVTFEGDHYRTDRATIYDRPDEPVPIYVAASGPLAAKLAGRVGDGFIATSGKDPELYRDLLDKVAEGAQAAGRDAGEIDHFMEIKVSYDHDLEYAREACAFWAPLALTPDEKSGIDDAVEMEQAADKILDRARVAVHRLRRSRRGRRQDRPVRRARVRAPRLPRARPRPGAVPAVLLHRRAAADPRPVRRRRPGSRTGSSR